MEYLPPLRYPNMTLIFHLPMSHALSRYIILLWVTYSVSKTSTYMNIINKSIHKDLRKIVKSDSFSILEIDLDQPCAVDSVLDLCKSQDCRRPSILDNGSTAKGRKAVRFGTKTLSYIGGTPGYTCHYPDKGNLTRVDLNKAIQEYTEYKEGSNKIWKTIYDKTNDSFVERMISGIHFSITVHMSTNYKKKDGMYVSNFKLYDEKYKKEYLSNLYFAFLMARNAVHGLNTKMFKCSDIKSKEKKRVEKLFKKIRKEGKVKCDTKRCGEFKFDEKFFDEVDILLDCIECGSCKLWGKIQFYGLRSILKVLGGKKEELSSRDVFYLLHLFDKLSESLEFLWLRSEKQDKN